MKNKDIMNSTEKYGYFDIDNKEYVITRTPPHHG